jgi:3',5'-cyclic AMP phosphodiesterase CpdA
MTTPEILEILATRVETASSLDELYRALVAFEEEVEHHHEDFADDVVGALAQYIDIDRLPTFGGEPPKNMDEVRSWDKDRLLVGTGAFWELDFVERGETSEFRDVKNTLERRAALARKAYGARLKDVYRILRAHKEGSPLAHPGGINLIEQAIGAYFSMIQAKRDAEAGRAVEGEPIDNLVAAFDAWVASLPPAIG